MYTRVRPLCADRIVETVRVLIIDTYYAQFIRTFYGRDSALSSLPYETQWKRLMRECFGTADFYSSALKKLGHEAHEVVSSAHPLQAAWAREHSPFLWANRWMAHVPKLRRVWELAVLRAQVGWYAPDVVLVQNVDQVPPVFARWAKQRADQVVAQHASVVRDVGMLSDYDLVVSAVPSLVERLRQRGANAEYLKLAFGTEVLERLRQVGEAYDVVHVGGYGQLHQERNRFLEDLTLNFDCHFWGTNAQSLDALSPIRRAYRGEAWGIDMYRRRAASKVTVTKHIRAAVGNDVANCTMYETTGIGTCLVVDRGRNLHEIFEPDTEVVAYDNHQDAIEKIKYLLEHPDKREAIARAGQRRTLKDHTYGARMEELVELLLRTQRRQRVSN